MRLLHCMNHCCCSTYSVAKSPPCSHPVSTCVPLHFSAWIRPVSGAKRSGAYRILTIQTFIPHLMRMCRNSQKNLSRNKIANLLSVSLSPRPRCRRTTTYPPPPSSKSVILHLCTPRTPAINRIADQMGMRDLCANAAARRVGVGGELRLQRGRGRSA